MTVITLQNNFFFFLLFYLTVTAVTVPQCATQVTVGTAVTHLGPPHQVKQVNDGGLGKFPPFISKLDITDFFSDKLFKFFFFMIIYFLKFI